MIPLVGMTPELVRVRAPVADAAEAVCAEFGVELAYSIGTMIEIPRAVPSRIAGGTCRFFVRHQRFDPTAYGFSRDDMAKFFTHYQRKGSWRPYRRDL